MIFVKDRSNKYHIAELSFGIDKTYCIECLYFASGRAYLRKEQLPDHIKLCGLCLKRYNERGLYSKYSVKRRNPNVNHIGCKYFVLDVSHDPNAIPALRAYIEACREDYPKLAADLSELVEKNK